MSQLPRSYQTRALRNIAYLRRKKISTTQAVFEALESPSTGARDIALLCWALARLRMRGSSHHLVNLLRSHREDIWMPAATALSELNDQQVLQALIELLKTARETKRRMAAAYALSFMKAGRAPGALLAAFRTDASVGVRSQAAEGLGNHWYRPALNDLIRGLKDRSASVRFWCVFALGKIGDARALPFLRRIAKRNSGRMPRYGLVRKEAQEMIKAIQQKRRYVRTGKGVLPM